MAPDLLPWELPPSFIPVMQTRKFIPAQASRQPVFLITTVEIINTSFFLDQERKQLMLLLLFFLFTFRATCRLLRARILLILQAITQQLHLITVQIIHIIFLDRINIQQVIPYP